MSYFIEDDSENSKTTGISNAPVSNTTTDNAKVTSDLSMINVASDMDSYIGEKILSIVLANAPRIYTAQVMEVVDENHYNLRVISSSAEDSIINNIINQSRFDLNEGDYVQLLDTTNNLSTSYIIAKMNVPVSSAQNSFEAINDTQQIPLNECILRYKGERWYLLLGKNIFDSLNFINTPITDSTGEYIITTKEQALLKVNILRLEDSSDPHYNDLGGRITIPRIEGGNDYIRITENVFVNKPQCDVFSTPAIDITEIVNNFIFEDAYRYSPYDGTKWTKKFGLRISNVIPLWQHHNWQYSHNGRQYDITINGSYVWQHNGDVYYSYQDEQFKLNQETMFWEFADWDDLIDGSQVWTDGTTTYYSNGRTQMVFNGTDWDTQIWTGLSSCWGAYIWTDGTTIYHTVSGNTYYLDGTEWKSKTWDGDRNILNGNNIWVDPMDQKVYYSYNNVQLVLNGSEWREQQWVGYTISNGSGVWNDGSNIYYSGGPDQYVLNKSILTWEKQPWAGFTNIYAGGIWKLGSNIYYGNSYATDQYILDSVLWESEISSAYIVEVYRDVNSNQYNINNLNWLGARVSQLKGDFTTGFTPNPNYVYQDYSYMNYLVKDGMGGQVYFKTKHGEDFYFKVIGLG